MAIYLDHLWEVHSSECLIINLFMLSRLFYSNSLYQSISNERDVWLVFIMTMFHKKNPVINANSADPDQMLQNAVSDLGLHCLPVFLLWDARPKWDNVLHAG